MINIIILLTIWIWYFLLFRVIENKQNTNKILYILLSIFVTLLIIFICTLFNFLLWIIILFILYLIIIISIYTDFYVFIVLYEIYLKSKKVKNIKEDWIKESISLMIKKDIREIKTSLNNFWWYNDIILDLFIISGGILAGLWILFY